MQPKDLPVALLGLTFGQGPENSSCALSLHRDHTCYLSGDSQAKASHPQVCCCNGFGQVSLEPSKSGLLFLLCSCTNSKDNIQWQLQKQDEEELLHNRGKGPEARCDWVFINMQHMPCQEGGRVSETETHQIKKEQPENHM